MEHFIKNIEITNFKSIRHAEVKDCRRVNVFVGPPNVGKSNILEALSGFSYLLKSKISDIRSLIRFQKSTELFYNANTTEFGEISLNSNLYLSYTAISPFSIDIKVSSISQSQENDKDYTHRNVNYFFANFDKGNLSIESEAKLHRSKKIIKPYKYKTTSDYILAKGQSLLMPYGENLKDVIEGSPEIRKEVVSLFKSYNQRLLLDKAESDIRVLWFLDDETVFSVPFELIADTLKRLIFYKAAILSNRNTVLLFEEPEAHCYEPYILEFTNTVKRDENNNQFFIVTHSQYVIEELLRDEESRNDTNIYLVGLENNETKVKLLSQEMNKEIYQTGLNVFFNYQSLWNEISEHEAVH